MFWSVYPKKFNNMFFLVDAFTNKPFLGNPAGVCVLEDIINTTEMMQKAAAYFNWSEIAFISKISENKFNLRWFSPRDEAPLCGHATLAAAHIIFSQKLTTSQEVEFLYKDGSLLVENNGGDMSMYFPLKPVVQCEKIPFKVKDLIGDVEYESVWKDDFIYMIVLKDHESVQKVEPNLYVIAQIEARAILITSKGFDSFDCSSRYFAPRVGLYEDPVCGSAHCRLAYYWTNVLNKKKLLAFQASKRTGVLKVEITGDQRVKISGQAITVANLNNLYSLI